jgi:epsilon-lactone hydrolase
MMLTLGPRQIPLPATISDAARNALTAPWPTNSYPPLDDLEAWRVMIAKRDAEIMAMIGERMPGLVPGVRCELGGAVVYRAPPFAPTPDDRRIYLDFHGGALILLGGEPCGLMASIAAMTVGAPVVSVDYRMPPDHPYPAAIDDGVAVYRALLADHAPGDIVVGGLSAGGNIAAATVLRARDEGLPLPAGLVLLSPEIDLTESGDSFETLLGIDRIVRFTEPNALYAAGAALDDPYVSPLFGDFTKGFPPTFLQSGTRDLFLSNTVLMHRALRRAGVAAELHVFEAMPHGGFQGAPEDVEVAAEQRGFAERCWAAAGNPLKP